VIPYTKEYFDMRRNPKAKFTAWQLAGDWWWVDEYVAILVNGKLKYETATATKGGTGKKVALRRVKTINNRLTTITRYVHPHTLMILEPVENPITF